MSIKSSEKGDKKEGKEVEVALDNLPKDEMAKMLLELKGEIDILKQDKRSIEDVDESEYDTLDDYLEDPAVFFAFSYEYAIHSDFRRGKEVLPPLDGFFKFLKLYRYSRKNIGRGQEVVSVSQITVRSKSMATWLRGHSLFGIKFFENINDAKSVDTTLAEKMAEQSSKVSNMNDHQIIERAKTEGIPLHNDIDRLRRELVQTMAEKELKRRSAKVQEQFKTELDENNRRVEYRQSDDTY